MSMAQMAEIMNEVNAKRDYVRARLAAESPFPIGAEAAAAVHREIEALELTQNALELETQGYTVLTPEQVGSRELVPRLNEAIDRVVAEREGKAWMEQPSVGTVQFTLLPEDRVFEEALLSPKPLALLTYLLGYHAKLSLSVAFLKGRGAPGSEFHSDHHGKFPLPWPHYAQVANLTWMLTDYTAKGGGPLCVVPGSHQLAQPPGGERVDVPTHPGAVPVEGPAGSVVVWHGNLWHGSQPREIDGLRRTLILYFCRSYLEAQEMHKFMTTREMLERNPARFGSLVGLTEHIPWIYGPWGEPSPVGVHYPVTGIYQHE